MDKFEVGDEVEFINDSCLVGQRGDRKIVCKVDVEGSTFFRDGRCCAFPYDHLKLISKGGNKMSKYEVKFIYEELKQEIEAMNGNTSLQKFGELLLKVGQTGKYLVLPTIIGRSFAIEGVSPGSIEMSAPFNSPCDAIPALKKCFMWLLDHSDIKKDIVGTEQKIEIDGKTYKAKIVEEI